MHRGDTILGRFRLVEPLGSQDREVSTWRVAALAVDGPSGVLKLAAADSSAGEELRREAALLASIPAGEARAARVAPLLAQGEDERLRWLLQEDVGALDLGQHWAEAGVDFAGVLDVGQAVAGALTCLHGHGVLHRDVKEGNVVVARGRGPARFWLVDLGIGGQLGGRRALTADLRGSYDRVPPEALTAGRKVGPAGDVFVLCKMLAQALLGSFNVAWPDDVDAQVIACGLDPADPRHLALVRLLARGMRLDPEQRPNAAALRDGFADIRAGRVGPRRARWWLPLATFAAGGVTVAAWLLWPAPPPAEPVVFEDASAAWGLAVATPDAARVWEDRGPSSGFFGHPTAVDADGDGAWEILLPRLGRVWAPTLPEHTRDLALSWRGGRVTWSLAEPLEHARHVARWSQADLDGDGVLDRAGIDHDDGWIARTVVELSGRGFVPEVLAVQQPFLVPSAAGPGLLDGGALASPEGAPGRWTAEALGGFPASWLDLEGDGSLEVLLVRDRRLGLARWREGVWDTALLGEVAPTRPSPPASGLSVADLDGDGDEDLVVVDRTTARLAFFEGQGGDLVRASAAGLPFLDPGEEVRDTYSSVQAVDLDGDGLRDLVLGSGGFPDKGHATSKVWRNLGGWQFERVSVPASLASPVDGAIVLPLDVDGDGRLDLLHFSINDRAREVPDHRAWRNRGTGAARQWPLRLVLPDGGLLPPGAHVEATEPRPWLQVVRETGPLYLPDWVAGTLLVVLPDGRVGTAALGDGLDGAAERSVSLADLPPLLAFGRQPVAPGRSVAAPGVPLFHALSPGWELELNLQPGPGGLILWNGPEPMRRELPLYGEGLGCPEPDRCLILLNAPGGGYTPTILDPRSGATSPLTAPGDMALAFARGDGRAWTASAGRIWERHPETYEVIAPERVPEPKLECNALGWDGAGLACACQDPPVLVVYHPDTLHARQRVVLPAEPRSSLIPVPGGWLVAVTDGLVWVDGDGAVKRTSLGGPPLLVSGDGGAWALLPNRALWLDTTARVVVGGMVAPGVAAALPVPEGGQLAR